MNTVSIRTLMLASALTLAASHFAVAGGFDQNMFERFVESNMGTDGKPVYYYSIGTVKTFPGGELLANIEGVDMARLLKRDADGTVHKASRKMFILRDPKTGAVIEKVGGKPNDQSFYPYQYMTFKLGEHGELHGGSTQGAGAKKHFANFAGGIEARRVGDIAVFSAVNSRQREDSTGSYEMYEFWVLPKNSNIKPSATLTLTLVNWHPLGKGKPVYTHRTSWRVDRYEDLPASLRGYIDAKAPLYREPPRDMAEIERLQQ
ncbi:MAG: hypothetical protein IPG25_18990 [Proteobacteria bacterium]|nr:hypothetical protein [Pseudomonadota bacterium]